jgi:hypothetical protein
MLDVALEFVRDELNSFFSSRFSASTEKVKLSNVVDYAGKFLVDLDCIGLSVINLEEERVVKTHLPQYTYVNGQHVVTQPELKVNVDLLFAANFQFYEEALKYLSYVLLFFQTYPSLSQDTFPTLDASIEKLVFELQSPSYEQWNVIWGYNGGKQLPCLAYKMRLVVIQPETPFAIQPPLTVINTTLQTT